MNQFKLKEFHLTNQLAYLAVYLWGFEVLPEILQNIDSGELAFLFATGND